MELIDRNSIKDLDKENIVKTIDESIDTFLLEKSKETLREIIDKQLYIDTTPSNTTINAYEAIETVLQELDNSISKDKVKEYLEIEKEKFKVYKKASEENENLKGQMWHHMGAKNMCERLLVIEKTVTLD